MFFDSAPTIEDILEQASKVLSARGWRQVQTAERVEADAEAAAAAAAAAVEKAEEDQANLSEDEEILKLKDMAHAFQKQ